MSTSARANSRSPEIRPVPVSSIQKAPRADIGISIDPSKVSALSELMRNGVPLPPIKVWWDGTTYWLSDGLHRLSAAEQAGLPEILSEIHGRAFSDAQWDSYALSGIRVLVGLPPADRRRFYALALRQPIAASLSDAQIASHLGVTRSFVQYRRRISIPQRAGAAAQTGNISDEIVLKTVSYLHRNLGSRLSVPCLAHHVAVSAPHLSRRFRLADQLSPKVTLKHLRMERALELLLATDLSVKEIAGQVGYDRRSAFHRAFVQVCGVAPSELRRYWRSQRES